MSNTNTDVSHASLTTSTPDVQLINTTTSLPASPSDNTISSTSTSTQNSSLPPEPTTTPKSGAMSDSASSEDVRVFVACKDRGSVPDELRPQLWKVFCQNILLSSKQCLSFYCVLHFHPI